MDLNKTLEHNCSIKTLCLRIGDGDAKLFEKVTELLRERSHKIKLLPFWQNDIKETTKITLPTRVEHLVKTHACILFYNANCNLVENFQNEFTKLKKKYIDDKTAYRVYVFNAKENDSSYFETQRNVLIIPDIVEEELINFLNNDIQVLIANVITTLSNEIIKLKTDNHNVSLFNVKEEKITDSSKMKRRKQGRSLKVMADYALMFGCIKDATAYYSQALEILRVTADNLWIGGVLEGQCSAVLLKYKHRWAEVNEQPDSSQYEGEVVSKLQEAQTALRRVKPIRFEIECFSKYLTFLKSINSRMLFLESLKALSENPLPGLLPEENQKLLIKLSSACHDMKLFRKAGFYLRQAITAMQQEGSNIDLIRDYHLFSFPYYYLTPLLRKISSPLADFYARTKALEDPYFHNKDVKVWPKIQITILLELLSVCYEDSVLKLKLSMELLNTFREDLAMQTQNQLVQNLVFEGTHLPKNLQTNLLNFPQIIKIEPLIHQNRYASNQLISAAGEKGKDVFIFEPWQKGLKIKDLMWSAGEQCMVKVFFQNLYSLQIVVDLCTIDCEGVEIEHYPTSFMINRETERVEVTIKFRPTTPGKMNIKGIVTKCCNVACYHPLNERGDCLHYVETCGKNVEPQKDMRGLIEAFNIHEIVVRDSFPALEVGFVGSQESPLRVYNKCFEDLKIKIQNKSQTPVGLFVARLRFEFNETALDYEVNIDDMHCQTLNQLEPFYVQINMFKPSKEPLQMISGGLIVNIDHLKNRANLKKISMRYQYAYDRTAKFLKEDLLIREVQIMPSFELENVHLSDLIKVHEIILPHTKYNVRIIEDSFYLNVDVINHTSTSADSNDEDFTLTFYNKLTQQKIEDVQISRDVSKRVVLYLPKQADIPENASLNDIIDCKWMSLTHLKSGYVKFPEVSEKELNILSKIPVSMEVASDLQESEEVGMTAKIALPTSIQLKLNFESDFESKNLELLCFISDQSFSNAALESHGVLFNGKSSFHLTVDKNSDSFIKNLHFRFIRRGTYNLYCILVNNQASTIYIYKHQKAILVA